MRVQKVQKVQRVQRVVVSPLRAMNIKSALRIHLSVSYGMIGILLIGSLRSPPLSGFVADLKKIFLKPLAISGIICYDNTVARNKRLGA